MAEGGTPRGAPSALLRTATASTTASDGGAVVNESLEGLVSAVDELKRSMGLGEAVDLTAIEQFIARLRQENEEFRQYAEQAILVRRAACGLARGASRAAAQAAMRCRGRCASPLQHTLPRPPGAPTRRPWPRCPRACSPAVGAGAEGGAG